MTLPTFNGSSRIDSWLKYLPKTDGEVVGNYAHSIDVKVMDFIINFNTQEDGLHPLGILITPELKRILERDKKVNIAYPFFAFAVAQVQVEPRNFPYIEKKIEKVSLRENSQRLFNTISSFGRPSDVSITYLRRSENRFSKPVLGLCMNLKRNRWVNLDEHVSLFGCGQGLTPSWDDFCVGLLLGDRVFKSNAIFVGKNFFRDIRPKTTLTSFWQLKFAEVGKMSLLYERLMSKLQLSKLSAAEMVKCINFGHSSGTDILCGIHAFLNNFLLAYPS